MSADVSDGDLARLARGGDPVAFRLLVERHQAMVRARARQLGPGPGDVNDIVQESFLQAFLALDRLRDPDRFAGWLSRRAAATAAFTFPGLAAGADGIRTSRMAASGASACTISVSSTSSKFASQGDASCARAFTTCSRGPGRPNTLSNRVRSCRMSVTAGGDPAAGGNSSSATVCPRPVIPRSSSGWMP